jgi:hypothetical protein
LLAKDLLAKDLAAIRIGDKAILAAKRPRESLDADRIDQIPAPVSNPMGGWLRQIVLNAQVRTGLSPDTVIWAAVAAIAAPLALIFFLIAAFIWLSDRYDSLIAGVILGAFFLAVALIAIWACVMVRRRNIERARFELEVRKSANPGLLDPKLMAMGYQVGQAIGWRKVASLAAVGLLAAALAREWLGHKQASAQDDEADDSES